MPSRDAITHWITQLQAGDQIAAQELWQHYFERLVNLARKKLKGRTLTTTDEEDVALSAFNSFVRGARQGRYPQLADRDNLWKILVVITAHKVLHLVRDEGRQKRGGDRRPGQAVLSRSDERALEQIAGKEPTPQFAAQVADQCRRLLANLASNELESIALWKMEGFTTEEIAGKLNCAPRTVERKLRLIRTIWEKEKRPQLGGR